MDFLVLGLFLLFALPLNGDDAAVNRDFDVLLLDRG